MGAMPSLRSLLGALIALATMASPCLAGGLTEIPGADDKQEPLPAYLATPSGSGPFPAVVVLHGGNGFNSNTVSWADRLASWGYVALAIDSLTCRGKRTACAGNPYKQPHDAYQGLKFLAAQPFVRADRIAVMGNSRGGSAVLAALERGLIEPMFPMKFRSPVVMRWHVGHHDGADARSDRRARRLDPSGGMSADGGRRERLWVTAKAR